MVPRDAVTGNCAAAAADRPQRRHGGGARIARVRAAGMEAAAGGRIERAGRVALEHDRRGRRRRRDRPAARRRSARACRDARRSSTAIAGPASTIWPRYITSDAVGEMAHHREVVRDEQHRRARASSCSSTSRLSTCACTDTSSADTGSSQISSVRVERERAGDADALALAAGELVRVALERRSAPQPDRLEQLARPARARSPGADAVHAPAARPRCAPTRDARVERAERVLEHHLHAAPMRPHARRGSRAIVRALEPIDAGIRLAAATQDRLRERGLAAARLADQRHASRRARCRSSTPSTACTGAAPRREATARGHGPRAAASLIAAPLAAASRSGCRPPHGVGPASTAAAPRADRRRSRRAARREGAARRQLVQRRHGAGDLRQPRRGLPPCGPRVACEQALRCRDARARGTAGGRRPSSTMRPAYITATRSAMSATTPRSCVIRISAMPRSSCSRCEQRQDLRLDGDVERGGRLVGDQQARARRRCAMAIIARWRCRPRAGADSRRAGAPASGMPTSSSSAIARRRGLGARRASRCGLERLDDLVADREHRVERPSSAPGRSWRSRRRAPRIADLRRRDRPAPCRRARTAPSTRHRPWAGSMPQQRQRRSPTCRSPIRRPAPAFLPRRAGGRGRRPP